MTAAHTPPILVADIGGTHARFGLADPQAAMPLLKDSIREYRVADFATLDDAMRAYLADGDSEPNDAVLALAGRIVGPIVHATNSPWRMDAERTRRALGFSSLRVINDFVAQSLCLPLLPADELAGIGDVGTAIIGAKPTQTFAVIGPGTGLGVGTLLFRDDRFFTLETEGGHASFAAQTPEEWAVLARLATRFGHVSWERLISGQGLVNLHGALAEIAGAPAGELTAEQITAKAHSGNDGLCVKTVDMLCALLGAMAGDVALTMGAWDGVYLGGGLSPLLLPWLQGGAFRQHFEAKGRLRAAMLQIPTQVITCAHAGLLGAAASAVLESGRPLLRPASQS